MYSTFTSPLKNFGLRLVLLGAILISLFAFSPSATAQTATFRNPLNNSGPDPFMFYYNGNYYLAATTWGGASVGLTMRKASTIAGIKAAAATRIWQDSTASRCCNYWAPEFYLINGHWYGYFTGGASGTNYTANQHIHVIESSGTDPMGPYTYKGQLVSRAALDGSIVTINGTMYAIYSVWNTRQEVAIKQMTNPWTTTGSEVVIVSPTLSWEIQDGNVAEGPVAFQRNGATYIVYSASACWGPNYKLGQTKLTGSNPLSASSWTKKTTPIFQQGNGAYGPGHNNFFKSPDGTEDWIIYHANDQSTDGCDMGRTPRIQKFTVNADGSPNLGSPVSTNTDLAVPSGEGGANPTPTPTRTNTPIGPTATPTRTNTPGGPTATPTRTNTPGGVTNLAQGKPATADSAQSSNPVANGNDGNTSTRWCAANGNTGHWWRVDLGSTRNLTGSEVMWEFARNYKYRVEVSNDDANWTTVVDKTNNTSTAQTQNDPFTASARYVRITVTGLTTSPVTWASFFEFRVFGS